MGTEMSEKGLLWDSQSEEEKGKLLFGVRMGDRPTQRLVGGQKGKFRCCEKNTKFLLAWRPFQPNAASLPLNPITGRYYVSGNVCQS